MNIAFLYEHPSWSDDIIQAFSQQGVDLTPVNLNEHFFCTNMTAPPPFDLAINRINIMPSASAKPQVAFQTLHYLNWLTHFGVRIINGAKTHFIGASKAMQNGIFSSLGLACPKAIAIHRAQDALLAATQIGFPLIIKPNIGGSGNAVEKFENQQVLRQAIENKSLDLGVDQTGIVQEYIESDGYIYRIEILGNELFYSIRQTIQEGAFNYCAADGCSTDAPIENDKDTGFCLSNNKTPIETFQPDKKIIQQALSIVKACEADVAGVEYLIDQKTNKPCFYDFNPYSNFIHNGATLLGFSPQQKYVRFIQNILCSQT